MGKSNWFCYIYTIKCGFGKQGNVSKPGMPLSAYSELDFFKVYACDCGLLRRLARIPAEVVLDGNSGYTEFKGAMAENLVLQIPDKIFVPEPPIQRRPPQLPVSAGRMDSEIAGALQVISYYEDSKQVVSYKSPAAFHSLTVRVAESKFTPTFTSLRPAQVYGTRYPLLSICFNASSAEPSSFSSKT